MVPGFIEAVSPPGKQPTDNSMLSVKLFKLFRVIMDVTGEPCLTASVSGFGVIEKPGAPGTVTKTYAK